MPQRGAIDAYTVGRRFARLAVDRLRGSQQLSLGLLDEIVQGVREGNRYKGVVAQIDFMNGVRDYLVPFYMRAHESEEGKG